MDVLKSFDLSGKTALVTGCKRGIGRGMAEALAQAGADIVGVSASLEVSGSEVEQAVTALGRRFTGYQCDFSDRAAVTAFAAQLDSDGVAPDILVNNAGTIKRKPAAEHPDARAAARVIHHLDMLLPAIKLDTEPLIEEAERIEEQIKSMMMHKLQASEEDMDPSMTEGASSMLYG